jgi:hypothetical protein
VDHIITQLETLRGVLAEIDDRERSAGKKQYYKEEEKREDENVKNA